MASFVGYARKHNPNPKTKAQDRESNHGGKLADDHFQRLFLGGAVKQAVPTGAVTARVGDVLGSGTATVSTITSDTVDGPPFLTTTTETIYNATSTAYTSSDTVEVVDTGRFFVIVSAAGGSSGGSGGIYRRDMTIFEYDTPGATYNLSTANLLGGVIQRTAGGAITFNAPTAATIVSDLAGTATVGTAIKFILSNAATTGASVFLNPEAGSEVANVNPVLNNSTSEYTLVLVNVSPGTEAYKIYQVSS
jgi:hypothetical protein